MRDKALAEVAVLLEGVVRDELSDRELAASLDGVNARNVTSDGEFALGIAGTLWTLGLPRKGVADRGAAVTTTGCRLVRARGKPNGVGREAAQ